MTKFHVKKKFNFWKTVKIGSKEFFSLVYMLVDFEYLFLVNILALEFCACIFNKKMILWQNFHGKIPSFELSGGFQSGNTKISLTANSKTTF